LWVEIDSLAGKAKAVHAKYRICSLLPIGRQMLSHPQESRAPLCISWEDKLFHHEDSQALEQVAQRHFQDLTGESSKQPGLISFLTLL